MDRFRRKIDLIFAAIAAVFVLLMIAVMVWFDLKSPLVPICMIPLMILVYALVIRMMEKGRYRKEMEELEKELEAEEKRGKEKPKIYNIVFLSVVLLVVAVIDGVNVVTDMIENESFTAFLPDFVGFVTMFIIGGLVAGIAYNVWKGRVFYSRNSVLMNLIGATFILSALVQNHCWEATTMIPNVTVFMYFILFGGIIIFFGSLFDIAIRIKEDQDLTI